MFRRRLAQGALVLCVVFAGAAPAAAGGSATDPVSGHYPVLFLLCDFKNWHYEPNSISFYNKLWIRQHSTGTFSSLADYFHDESFGKFDLKGSRVKGWYQMPISAQAWYSGGNGNRLGVRWRSCVNAAMAQGLSIGIIGFRAVVVVTPYVRAIITGAGVAAEPKLGPGQKRPAAEQITVDSTKDWPPAPFLMSLPADSLSQYGENVLVSKVKGDTLTISRGYNEGQAQQTGPFPAIGPGGTVVPDTDDDFAYVGPQTLYVQLAGQHCQSGRSKLCPSVTTQPVKANPRNPLATSNVPAIVGVANLFAGDNKHDGNVTAGVGDSAHEVGHTTGYNHSRVLTSSTSDYNDCYDQMSYNACGLPGFQGEFGPRDGVIGYDAIDLEFHGWLPAHYQYNHAGHSVKQITIKLHALSDPHALRRSKGEYLDAHMPAKIRIEDVSPNNVAPAIPPRCTGTGYHCASSRYYTVEYRQRYGFDSPLELTGVAGFGGQPQVGAVVLHLYAPDNANPNGNISYLVDAYPGKTDGHGHPVYLPNEAGLQPGDDYADPSHNTYVAVNAFDKSAFTATVTLSSNPIAAKFKFLGGRTGKAGTTATLRARLTVGGAPVPGQPVSLSVGPGDSCGPVFTNSHGLASCNATLPKAAGTWPFQAYFPGDSVYLSLAQYSTFSVTP